MLQRTYNSLACPTGSWAQPMPGILASIRRIEETVGCTFFCPPITENLDIWQPNAYRKTTQLYPQFLQRKNDTDCVP